MVNNIPKKIIQYQFFVDKVNVITDGVAVDPAVYNGKKKLEAGNHMFMTTNDVKKCLESIKLKNTTIEIKNSN